MTDITPLVQLMQQRMEAQQKNMEVQQKQHQEQMEMLQRQMQQQRQEDKEAHQKQRQEESEAQQKQHQEQMEAHQKQHQEDKEALQKQMEVQQKQMEEQQKRQQEEREAHQKQLDALIARLAATPGGAIVTYPAASIPTFTLFDSSAKLWKGYLARFSTFAGAHSLPKEKMAQVFLTIQTTNTYKLLYTLAEQQSPPKTDNALIMEDIAKFMDEQFDPKHFTVRERFKFWSDMKWKPGETLHELATRKCQEAAT